MEKYILAGVLGASVVLLYAGVSNPIVAQQLPPTQKPGLSTGNYADVPTNRRGAKAPYRYKKPHRTVYNRYF